MCTANKNIESESINLEQIEDSYKEYSSGEEKEPEPTELTTGFANETQFVSNDAIEVEQDKSTGVVSAFDVARYILKKIKQCSTMKLHKLLYYCQCWNLVWEEKPLFYQPIEAWANGPVVRDVFNFHKGLYFISFDDFTIGNEQALSASQKRNVDEVLEFYGKKTAQWLIDQTHSEDPWRNARIGMGIGDAGANVITLDSMHSYYASL